MDLSSPICHFGVALCVRYPGHLGRSFRPVERKNTPHPCQSGRGEREETNRKLVLYAMSISLPLHFGHVGSIDFVVNFLPHSRHCTLNIVPYMKGRISLEDFSNCSFASCIAAYTGDLKEKFSMMSFSVYAIPATVLSVWSTLAAHSWLSRVCL